MSSNLQNSIWPNEGGTLGQTKVQIPDGVTTTWPEGDALVNNFVFNKGHLVGFVDTKALIANDSKTTTFPYDYVNISLPSIAEGEMTYNYDQCTYVVLNGKVIEIIKGDKPSNEDDVPNEDDELEEINFKYMGCKSVNDITAVDPNYLTTDIVDGVWSEGLGDLENGEGMFYDCDNLISFSSDLSSLTYGGAMFADCSKLTSFNANLSSLLNGLNMFYYCFEVISFNSDLSSLTNGLNMFYGTKLDTASVQNIADTINTPSVQGIIHISIGNTSPNEQEEAAFNKIAAKNWAVYVGVPNGRPKPWTPTSLIPIDGEEQQTPIPFWAKPVPSDEEYAQYVDSEGNFYNILGGNFIYGDNLETYGMFTSLEDAAAQMRLTKIEK